MPNKPEAAMPRTNVLEMRARAHRRRTQPTDPTTPAACGPRYTTLLDCVGDSITQSWIRGISERSLAVTYQLQREVVEDVVRAGVKRRLNHARRAA